MGSGMKCSDISSGIIILKPADAFSKTEKKHHCWICKKNHGIIRKKEGSR